MFTHSKRLMKLSEGLTAVLLDAQVTDITSADFGDIIMEPKGFSEPLSLFIPLVNFVGAYYHPDSSYYKNPELIKRAVFFMDVMLAGMHEDGTMDLLETNFHDATATAFAITPLAYAYRLIQKDGMVTRLEKTLSEKMMDFFIRGAEGMRKGGFHTPNHRWVMTAALSLMYGVLGNEIYKEEALKYINEGIDCDEEGEYTERSAAIYDIAVNESLITAAEELGSPELLEHVKRNIKKNFAFLEPDGTICTINSTRQDYSTRYFPLRHYWGALYLAHKFNDPFFAYLAEELLKLMESMSQSLAGYLFTGGKEDVHNPIIQYLLKPELEKDIKTEKPEWNGEWYFEKNGVVRWRKDNKSLTLVLGREVFLKYQAGKNALHMKIGTCFFGKGYFVPGKIYRYKDGFRLEEEKEAGYVRPLGKKPENADWKDLSLSGRDKVLQQKQKITVDVVLKDKISLKVKIQGVEKVPLKIEMMLFAGGRLDTGSIFFEGNAGTHAILKKGTAAYTLGRDVITIEGGAFSHWFTSNMRGTAPASKDGFTLYLTGFTPFEHEIFLSSV